MLHEYHKILDELGAILCSRYSVLSKFMHRMNVNIITVISRLAGHPEIEF